MARRLIGLDVGTNAVTVAEVSPGRPPTLRGFGQVALPRDAMREGEVVDDAALTETIRRLRAEVGLRRGSVRLGIASPRVIVRQVGMPVMSRDELASALRFQAQDLIPIPIDEAVLDFAVLDTVPATDGTEPEMQVLVAAAQAASVTRLVEAVEAAGLLVESVDLVPLALVRALGTEPPEEDGGAEGIVSFGAGVTAVTIHEGGVPRFVRVLGTGGRALTDAIASELDIADEAAESLKRQIGTAAASDDVVARARAAIDRPLGSLLDEVRSSLDYYRNQPGAARLLRVVVTGGGAQLPGLVERLGGLVGVPVEPAAPRQRLEVGDIGFDADELPRLDPYLPAAVGLALGGDAGVTVDLHPRARRSPARRRALAAAAVAGIALLVVLGALTAARAHQVSHQRDELAAQQATNATLQARIQSLQDVQAKEAKLASMRTEITGLLRTDVSWSRMLQEIAKTIPNDVWLTSFQGNVTVSPTKPGLRAGTVAPPSGSSSASTTTTTTVATVPQTGSSGTISGTVTFQAVGLEFPSVAAWIERVGADPSFADLWVANATKGQLATRDVVNFTSTADLTDSARSDRFDTFAGSAP